MHVKRSVCTAKADARWGGGGEARGACGRDVPDSMLQVTGSMQLSSVGARLCCQPGIWPWLLRVTASGVSPDIRVEVLIACHVIQCQCCVLWPCALIAKTCAWRSAGLPQ